MAALSDAQVAGYAKGAGFTGTNVVIAVAIAHAESGCRTDATNANKDGSTDRGVWQINSVHADLLAAGNWADPASNAHMAFVISGGGTNWTPWTTFNSGAYLPFMPAGLAAANAAPIKAGTAPATTGATITPTASVSGVISGAGDFAKLITDPLTWLRVAEFLAGIMLAFIGLKGVSSVARTTAKVARGAGEAALLA